MSAPRPTAAQLARARDVRRWLADRSEGETARACIESFIDLYEADRVDASPHWDLSVEPPRRGGRRHAGHTFRRILRAGGYTEDDTGEEGA